MGTILVTGNGGYVGVHTVLLLQERGYRVIGLDNLSTGRRHYADLADEWVEAGLNDLTTMETVFKSHKIDGIIHCAALALVGESMTEPEKYYRVNVGGTANLLKLARQYGVMDFVFSSTAATYGEPEVEVITEEIPQEPINPYGESKLAVEKLIWAAQQGWGLRPVVFRYFNVAGADSECRVGEDREIETHLVPNILIPAAQGGNSRSFTIFGDDYPTPDGTCVRDYIHVCDLADAHERALSYLSQGGAPEAFNLGTGRGYSVREVFDKAQEVIGSQLSLEIGERRPGDPPFLVTSNEKAHSVLGWQPLQSSLHNILQSAWKWHQKCHGS